MKREFRRPREGELPTAGGLDELLDEPPTAPAVGPLTGYRDGSRVRRRVYLGLILGVIGAGFAGRWYVGYLKEKRRTPTPQYQLAAGTEDEARPKVLVWSSGVARLGMSRQDPGVKAIVLPDRTLRLAKGCDHAQVKVNVVNGETVSLKVVVGEIRQVPREPAEEG